ncbi:MAG TPA: hypothetical protein GX747_00600 [Tenericutes bacterium]|nr:hypothetical protein [Mycoplasmatota bacterium]
MNKKTILPFGIKYTPIKKLAIISFEKKPDKIYRGLELQYLDCNEVGKGFRVLAYRNDGYVDIYDDTSLKYNQNEQCNVAGKGLHKHIQTKIENTFFEKVDGCVEISFDFIDIDKRPIHVYIKEQNKKKSIPMNLLAPIGFSSVDPMSLPIFFLYNFDFIRRKNTIVDIRIDQKLIGIDPFPFPFPMSGQRRYYSRYTMESQIIEFAPVDMQLKEVELDDNMQYIDQKVKYKFIKTSNDLGLSLIELELDKKVIIKFEPEIVMCDQIGEFYIYPKKEMGYIGGKYEIKRKDELVNIFLTPIRGWTSTPNSMSTKIILSSKSLFCTWCKKYEYSALINLKEMSINEKWINNNKKNKIK